MCVLCCMSLLKLKQHLSGRAFWIKDKRPFGNTFYFKPFALKPIEVCRFLSLAYEEAGRDRWELSNHCNLFLRGLKFNEGLIIGWHKHLSAIAALGNLSFFLLSQKDSRNTQSCTTSLCVISVDRNIPSGNTCISK